MNRNEQEYYKDIKRIANALEKLANKQSVIGGLASGGPVKTKSANKIKHV